MKHLVIALFPFCLSAAEPAAWPLNTDVDPYAPSPIDLRYLNEAEAGAQGPIRTLGDELTLADGSPLRIWGVAPMDTGKASDEDLARHARFLARLGVNLVRLGGADSGIVPQEPGQAFTEVNAAWVGMVHRTVAAMKREGIYTRISPLWDHGSIQHIGANWGLDGYQDGMSVNGLVFFEPHLQAAWKNWMRILLTEPGPNGNVLSNDNGLAIIQIVSEDSLFFWWTDKISGGPRAELERRLYTWAERRYGSAQLALAAWNDHPLKEDQLAERRFGILKIYDLISAPPEDQRAQDLTVFFAETERAWFSEATRYLREELGFRGLITTSNFPGVDQEHLGDAQRWAWSSGDIVEQNAFFSVPHQGPNSFWRIDAGHTYQPRSALKEPVLPTSRRQVADKPFINSSTNWLFPNPYQAEGPLLNAAYGAMQGLDGVLWLSAQAVTFDGAPHLPWAVVQGQKAMLKWTISHPAQIGMFPAAALIFRQRLIDPAPVVVQETRSLASVLAREPALVPDGGMGAISPVDPGNHGGTAPQAYLQGRVVVKFQEQAGEPATLPLAPSGPQQDSVHGQLRLNAERGVLQLLAPRAQGAIGFLGKAGTQHLPDLTIDCAMDYAAVVAVPLDTLPLAQSRSVLIQVGSVIRPSGWAERPAGDPAKGQEITATGSMPWLAPATQVSLTLKNTQLSQATVLDLGGQPQATVPITRSATGISLTLPQQALYVLLTP